jgi:hypothetical protein
VLLLRFAVVALWLIWGHSIWGLNRLLHFVFTRIRSSEGGSCSPRCGTRNTPADWAFQNRTSDCYSRSSASKSRISKKLPTMIPPASSLSDTTRSVLVLVRSPACPCPPAGLLRLSADSPSLKHRLGKLRAAHRGLQVISSELVEPRYRAVSARLKMRYILQLS